jgi:hypothetical protein
MRPLKEKLDYIPLNVPLGRDIVTATIAGGLGALGLYIVMMEELSITNKKYLEEDWVLKTFDRYRDRGMIGSYLESLSDSSLITISESKITINEIILLQEHIKKYREGERNKKSEQKQNNLNNSPTPTGDDYKALVAEWMHLHPNSETQVRTIYSRLRDKKDWDPDTIKRAIVYVKANPSITNKIMCDWYEAGLFKKDFNFVGANVNSYFAKKDKKRGGVPEIGPCPDWSNQKTTSPTIESLSVSLQ